MENEIAKQDVLVARDGSATIKCPGCRTNMGSNVEVFRGRGKIVKIMCDCGREFTVSLDFRKANRLDVLFDGYYSKTAVNGSWGYMKVVNLSLGGVGLKIIGNHDIRKGDELQIEFTLDDFPPSVVRRRVLVKNVYAARVSSQFADIDDSQEILARYLLT